MNKMLTRAKGILLQLKLTGVREDNSEKFAKTIKHIDDYLKTAVLTEVLWRKALKNNRKIATLKKSGFYGLHCGKSCSSYQRYVRRIPIQCSQNYD